MSVKHYTTAQFIATFGSEYNETDTGMLTVSYKADGVRIVIPLPENMQSVGHIVCEHLTTPFGDVLVAFDIMPANIFGSRQASLAHAVHTICSKEIQGRATPVVMKPKYTINEWHDARRDAFPYTEDGWIICDRNNRPAKWKPRLTYYFQVVLHKLTPSTNEFVLRATSSDDVSTRRTDDVKQYITLTPDEQKVIADAYEQSPIWNERIIEVYRERDSWRFIRPRPDKSKANRWQLVLDLLHDEDERARLQPTVTTVPEPTTTFCFKTVCCYHRHVKKHLYHVAGSGRTVLDVCAGKCKDARAWRASGLRHVVAVERDTNAVEYANKFIDELKQDDAPQHAMPPVDVLQMDMCVERLCKRLPAGFRFERAFCHFAIHYLFDGDTDTLCKSFIANMTHSLVAGAQFIVTFMDGECYNAEEGFCVGTGEDTFDVRAADEPLRGTYVRVPTIGTFHRERVVNTALLTKALQPHGFQFERKWSLGSFRHLVHTTEGVPIMLSTLERALVNRFSCALFTYRKDSLGADYLSPFAGKCPIVLRLVSSYLDGTSVVRFGSTTTALHQAILALRIKRPITELFTHIGEIEKEIAKMNKTGPYVGSSSPYEKGFKSITQYVAGLRDDLLQEEHNAQGHQTHSDLFRTHLQCSCIHCGCISEYSDGERSCFCDSCHEDGCEYPECMHCGCISTHYEGERTCFCNVCKFTKCEYWTEDIKEVAYNAPMSHKLVEHEYTEEELENVEEELENVLQKLQPQMDDDGYHRSNDDSDEEDDIPYEYSY